MTRKPEPVYLRRTVEELTIDDESSFRHVELYADLKEVLRRAKYSFRILPSSSAGRWDRALLLNLTLWGASSDGDVLIDEHLPADVVAHASWHHLAARALSPDENASLSPAALFLGESIASAFDVYLVGRLIGHASRSSFLESHVANMAETADAAGVPPADFEALLERVAEDPDRAFEDLPQLLCDATTALAACADADDGLRVLEDLGGHRFAGLLHGYELSNWVLYARARGGASGQGDARAREIDRLLRDQESSLDWLSRNWVRPAIDERAPDPPMARANL